MFLANGLGFANLVPRFPEIVAHLGLSKAAFGQAVAAASVGALLAGLAASWLISHLTSAKVASLGMLVVALALLGAGLARSWLVLAVCLLVVAGRTPSLMSRRTPTGCGSSAVGAPPS